MLSIRVCSFTHCNGHHDWTFDDPPIGGVLIYVPAPAEESKLSGAQTSTVERVGAAPEFLSTSVTVEFVFINTCRKLDGS